MKPVSIAVKDGRNLAAYHRNWLEKEGLTEDRRGRFSGTCRSGFELSKVRKYCNKHGLKFVFDYDGFSKRSSDYRRQFFKAVPPVEKDRYRCVYCGRLMAREKITVDHLYPVNQVSGNRNLQLKLQDMGIESVNDVANLVPACFSCNRRKSDKMGLWILKGRAGKSEGLWMSRKLIRTVLIMAVIYLILCIFFPGLGLPLSEYFEFARIVRIY